LGDIEDKGRGKKKKTSRKKGEGRIASFKRSPSAETSARNQEKKKLKGS